MFIQTIIQVGAVIFSDNILWLTIFYPFIHFTFIFGKLVVGINCLDYSRYKMGSILDVSCRMCWI